MIKPPITSHLLDTEEMEILKKALLLYRETAGRQGGRSNLLDAERATELLDRLIVERRKQEAAAWER